jgi:hypothetical protein
MALPGAAALRRALFVPELSISALAWGPIFVRWVWLPGQVQPLRQLRQELWPPRHPL